MAEAVLKVENREKKSKSFLKQLRQDGKIPGIYYTQGKPALLISLDSKDFNQLLLKHVNLFDLDFGKGRKKQSIIRELQYDPVKGDILHVDLMGIKSSEKIMIRVPINLTGTPHGVKEQGGILEHATRELEIECLPKDMPTAIDVDVSELDINDSIHASDIQIENAVVITDPETVIAHVVPPRLEVEAAPVEEVELEEGAEEAEEEKEETEGKESEEE